jgi:glutamyl-tRNA synthetase
VRFAPSPTGHLHIGGARTALYCHLIAKATDGQFILRIEDTDLKRSTKEYELKMIEDLKWCGLSYDEGPDCPGDVGPYRQSERLDLYKELAWKLVDQGHAYPCFLTDSELEELTNKAVEEKKSPHVYHDRYRDFDKSEARARVDGGDSYVIRFKNPRKKYVFTDIVRGEVTFPEDMVGDFVTIRSNGMPVYNFCCVVDDWKMNMTHVIRAEEHLNNTVRQLMIYEALGATPPQFAHCSLLVGEDRQKLSKRHGATSVVQYRDDRYLPQAMMNYLCLLGWSHPDEKDIFDMDEIVPIFDLKRFNKAPALYDIEKLKHFNGEHLKRLNATELTTYLTSDLSKDHAFYSLPSDKQQACLEFFKEKISLSTQLEEHLEVLFTKEAQANEELKEINTWETTTTLRNYIAGEVSKESGDFITVETFDAWTTHCKKELGVKGKPLFKGIRAVLTGMSEGPDLKVIIPLTPISILKDRLK